jgi:Tol biopolymer transport system component
MLQMRLISRPTLLATAVALVSVQSRRAATEEGNNNNSEPRLLIVMLDVADMPGDDANGPKMAQAIASNLRATGFELIEPGEGANVDVIPQFEKWRKTGAEWIVNGRISSSPDRRLSVKFRLWNVHQGQHIMAEQYFQKSENWYKLPPVITDAIIQRAAAADRGGRMP